MIRRAHERPEGMDEGTVIMSGISKERILESIHAVLTQFENSIFKFKIIQDYKIVMTSSIALEYKENNNLYFLPKGEKIEGFIPKQVESESKLFQFIIAIAAAKVLQTI